MNLHCVFEERTLNNPPAIAQISQQHRRTPDDETRHTSTTSIQRSTLLELLYWIPASAAVTSYRLFRTYSSNSIFSMQDKFKQGCQILCRRCSDATLAVQVASARDTISCQLKCGPGSSLRPGAISACPTMAVIGKFLHNTPSRSRRARYWAGAKSVRSSPSSSMPSEKSLQRSRPCQHDTPACQARCRQATNCTTVPSRCTRKWAETRRHAMLAK